MTPAETAPDPILGVEDVFIQRWGDMGAVWGINRTMAEIQGLLYITGATLSAEDIMARLKISRGSASMSLRGLLEWGIVRKLHRRGDRRDYYESLTDVLEIFTRVAQQRKKKEIDPILDTLRDCRRRLEDPADGSAEDNKRRAVAGARLDQMIDFLSLMEGLAKRFANTEGGLVQAIRLLLGLHPDNGRAAEGK